MQNNLLIKIRELEGQVNKESTNIEWAMKAFNHEFKVGYGETINNIDVHLLSFVVLNHNYLELFDIYT